VFPLKLARVEMVAVATQTVNFKGSARVIPNFEPDDVFEPDCKASPFRVA
jgi:hypothetical protein